MTGKTVFQYQMLEKLGTGGMGEVYKAQDTRLNRFVAIKVLPAKMSADPERRRRFIQEAQAASALNHPNIITIYDILNDGDEQYMVMEFIPGQTLHDLIGPGGISVPQVLQYGTQIADALATAHAAGIIHRDLKPSNIMVTRTGRVKILDFGLAKLTDLSPTASDATALGPLTQEGAILGTVSYMSPEQAEGKPVDARSDIFSFGSVLYEMITGRRAFDAGSSISTLSSVLRDDVRPIAEAAPETPPLLEAILSRCLPKDPNARWQSMKDVENALSSLKRQLDSEIYPSTTTNLPVAPAQPTVSQANEVKPLPPPSPPPAQPPPQPVPRSSKPLGLVLSLVALVIVVGAGGGVWWWWNNRHQAPPQQQAAQTTPAQTTAPAPTQEVPALPPVAPEPTPAEQPALNNASILDMVQANTPAEEIIKKIQTSKTNFNVSRQELNRLKQAGVPANVIKAMREATVPPSLATAPPRPSTPAATTPAQQPSAIPPPAPVEAAKSAPARRAVIATTPVSLGDGLPFRIVLAADVPSTATEGQTIRFTAVDGFKVGENIVIAKGATITGEVTGEKGKKILGIGGNKLTFRLLQADSVDGKRVNVRCMSGKRNDGPTIRSFETTKGGKVKGLAAAQGTEYIAYIDGDQTVSVRKQ